MGSEGHGEPSKVDVLNTMPDLTGHLYLSGVGLGVNLKMDTKKTCVEKRLVYVLKIVNLIQFT